MPIPDYQACMLPLLRFAQDGKPHSVNSAAEALAREFKLSDAEMFAVLPSRKQLVVPNRVGWARSYLKNAGLLDYPERGYFQITARGKALLSTNPAKINNKLLMQYDEFRAFYERARAKSSSNLPVDSAEAPEATPEEALENGFLRLTESLAGDILDRITACTPRFFEQLVVELLVAMGYGGSFKEAAIILGKPGDGGIDGIIKEDKLGLDAIYVQAKRWRNTVGRPEVQAFVGALAGHKARKGVFITTSSFSSDARGYVKDIDTRVILIDGDQLASLMIEYDLGVTTEQVYRIKRVDSDYFAEE